MIPACRPDFAGTCGRRAVPSPPYPRDCFQPPIAAAAYLAVVEDFVVAEKGCMAVVAAPRGAGRSLGAAPDPGGRGSGAGGKRGPYHPRGLGFHSHSCRKILKINKVIEMLNFFCNYFMSKMNIEMSYLECYGQHFFLGGGG